MKSAGFVDLISRQTVAGWAADPDAPDAVIPVTIFVNKKPYATVAADRPRDDLRRLGIFGTGAHGFTYTFPADPAMQEAFAVAVSVDGNVTTLPKGTADFGPLLSGTPAMGPNGTIRKRPLLVTGIGRSGTTLLMQKLSTHHDIAVPALPPFEFKLLTYYANVFAVLTAQANRARSSDPDKLEVDKYTVGSNPFFDAAFDGIFPASGEIARIFGRDLPENLSALLQATVQEFYDALGHREGCGPARYFAEKCYPLSMFRDRIRKLWPNYVEILLVRDPRDVYLSSRKFFTKHTDVLAAVIDGSRNLYRIATGDTPRLIVKYEDLLLNPQETMHAVCRYLDLSPDGLLDVPGQEQELARGHATTPAGQVPSGRWKAELSTRDAAALTTACAPFLRYFGYAG